MPELPDVTVYVEAIAERVVGDALARVRVASPFVLRSVDPPLAEAEGRVVTAVRRMGKRIVLDLAGDLHLVIHLMIAGRLKWLDAGAPVPRKLGLLAFDFPRGTLLLTEAGSKRRASLHLVHGAAGLAEHDRGGVEPLEVDLAGFRAALTREVHTLKRALTDPTILSGIGNAYSDEILHRAGLSPARRTDQMDDADFAALFEATRAVLGEWTERLRAEAGGGFPGKVTAFREGMAVHGRYRQPCPVCGTEIQRIRYADNETDYCPRCQTGGRLLSDRGLARLLREDWPKTIEALEARRGRPG